MKNFLAAMRSKNIITGYLYAYIHFTTEVVCFYFLNKVTENSNFIWLIPLLYDGLAFSPQAIIGYLSDKFPKVDFSIIGSILLSVATIICLKFNFSVYLALLILCIGNGLIHVNGAEVTLKASNGKLAHSAIFVAGGSFGVILGRLLAGTFVPYWMVAIFALTIIPFALLAKIYKGDDRCSNYNYANKKINPMLVVLLATFVVIVRGYMGYGIPTTWNKTVLQSIILFFVMGFGKALGGICADAYGVRKTAIVSTLLAIPFLCFGDNIMIISIIGIMLFSMTMSITLALLVSVLKKAPGLAFGFTTIGLFLGTAPIFYWKITETYINIVMISILSLLCCFILAMLTRKDDDKNDVDL